ncbi:hypothetical protein [Legionella septentrionalis]|uniref:hypothetical protein n=1 Tax=Legionella septentrionalis TaxID=2498109 RepID=UPI000F8C3150|nr:hypothetical protein [Legionella septentrionalis]RUQ93526.1 hypothetical protein ELY11_11685 [Legionella septentrionalis]
MSLIGCIKLLRKIKIELIISKPRLVGLANQATLGELLIDEILEEECFLDNLLEKLEEKLSNNMLTFEHELAEIERYYEQSSKHYLLPIKKELKLIQEKYLQYLEEEADIYADNEAIQCQEPDALEDIFLDAHSLRDAIYRKFLYDGSRIAELSQGTFQGIGSSKGYCYGFSVAMADENLSPYLNPGSMIPLNEVIYNIQKSGEGYRHCRITLPCFCPELHTQAQNLIQIANNHRGEDLLIYLGSFSVKHACYLSVQNDGKIRYTDPNHGVFRFCNELDFKRFYIASFYGSGSPYYFYEVRRLAKKNVSMLQAGKESISLLLPQKKDPGNDFMFRVSIASLITLPFLLYCAIMYKENDLNDNPTLILAMVTAFMLFFSVFLTFEELRGLLHCCEQFLPDLKKAEAYDDLMRIMDFKNEKEVINFLLSKSSQSSIVSYSIFNHGASSSDKSLKYEFGTEKIFSSF